MPDLAPCVPLKDWDFAEIVVALQIPAPSEQSFMGQLTRYLAQRFPDDDIEVAPARSDAGADFQVIPMASITGPGNRVPPLDMPPAARLDAITQAVFEFRKAARRHHRSNGRAA